MSAAQTDRLDGLFKRLEAAESAVRKQHIYAKSDISKHDIRALEELFVRLSACETKARISLAPSSIMEQETKSADDDKPVSVAATPEPATNPPPPAPPLVKPKPAAAPVAQVSAPRPVTETPKVEKEMPVASKAAEPSNAHSAPASSTPPAPSSGAASAEAKASVGKSGSLKEKGKNFFRPWQTRFFVLTDTSLVAYMDAKKEVQIASMLLTDITEVTQKSTQITIQMSTGKKELKAKSTSEADEWTAAIKASLGWA